MAALVAFDVFIGNGDRVRNMKASVANPQLYLFRAFDHSHALLNARRTPADSLPALASGDIIVAQHPFYGFVDLDDVAAWAKRIKAVPDTMVAECCEFNRDFRSATRDMQRELVLTRPNASNRVCFAFCPGSEVADRELVHAT